MFFQNNDKKEEIKDKHIVCNLQSAKGWGWWNGDGVPRCAKKCTSRYTFCAFWYTL